MPETKKCPFCAEEILFEAIKCKHCGCNLDKHYKESLGAKKLFSFGANANKIDSSVQPTVPIDPGKLKKTFNSVLLVVSVIFLMGCLIAIINPQHIDSTDTATKTLKNDDIEPDNIKLMGCAIDGVKKILKSPSSAKFPSRMFDVADFKIKKIKIGEYSVSSYVDAQNSFGAMIRTYYTCSIIAFDNTSDCYASCELSE